MEKEPQLLSAPKLKMDVKAHQKFLKIADKLSGIYSIISTEPLIFYVARSRNPVSGFQDSYRFLFENLPDQPGYFLCNWCWHIEEPRHIEEVKANEQTLIKLYPTLRFVHLCNTQRQTDVFQENGLNAIFCNQNCFLDESLFTPLPQIEKRFKAVYDARFVEFKRHYLASEINDLAIIYAQTSGSEFHPDYLRETKALLSKAHYFDHSESGEYRGLTTDGINQALNKCRVGLCLSAIEGAMYASGQYLLAGLPVVSTESLGGRNVFFDEEYTMIVEATPGAVSHGVDELIKRNLDPDIIRQRTIEKMSHHRRGFIALVQKIFDQEGVKKNFQDDWNKVFFNKLIKTQSHLETLKKIQS